MTYADERAGLDEAAAALPRWRPRPSAAGTPAAGAASVRPPFDDEPLRCGGPELTEAEMAELRAERDRAERDTTDRDRTGAAAETEDEASPRRAADLLTRRRWADRTGSPASGVIE